MELGSLTLAAPELVAAVGALFLPWIMNAIKSENWSDTFKVVVAFLICIAWTGLSLWLTDRLFEPEKVYFAKDYVLTALAVFLISHTAFKAWWEAREDTQFRLNRA